MKHWRNGACATAILAASAVALGQAPAQPSESAASGQPAVSDTAAPEAAPARTAPAAATKTYTVPAGTKVLLQLRSGINTKSARAGDGVYLSSTFPVVVGSRVMIPAGVYVQGVVDNVVHPGVKGRAQLNMHFTSIIFPNGTVVEIPGVVNSMPGAKTTEMKDAEGTIEGKGDKGRNVGRTAEIAIPTGGTVGSIGGLGAGHPVEGGLIGLGAGAVTTGIVALFTKNADINIESGTAVEMVLQRPLLLEEANLSASVPDGAMAPGLVPAVGQPRPLDKPTRRPGMVCPVGTLGCP